MIAVSLGSTRKIASSADMTIAMAYESRKPAWRLVSTLGDAPVLVPFASACSQPSLGAGWFGAKGRNPW